MNLNMIRKKTVPINILSALIMLFISTSCIAVWDLEDNFDDGLLNASLWNTTGSPTESGSIVACDANDEIISIDTFLYKDAEFVMKDLYDERLYLIEDPLAAGFTGFTTISGDQYILVRGDVAGQRLTLWLYKDGNVTDVGYINVPIGDLFDAQIRIYWSASEIKVTLSHLDDPGLQNTFIITDTAKIPDQPMHFIHHSTSVTTSGQTYNLDAVRIGTITSQNFSDHFDDANLDPNLWLLAAGGDVNVADSIASCSKVGSASSGLVSRELIGQYQEVRFGLRNLFDSRNLAIYDPVTIGYVGLVRQYHYIILRNDVIIPNINGPGLTLWTQNGYGVSRYHDYFDTGDGNYHDINVRIVWRPDQIDVEFDDLATQGIDKTIILTNTTYIPQTDENGDPLEMVFYSWINASSVNSSWDIDYVVTGPAMCQDLGYLYLKGDYDQNCVVELPDLALFVANWLTPNDFVDYTVMADNWLNCNDPVDPNCAP